MNLLNIAPRSVLDVLTERMRQIEVKGYSPDKDDAHTLGDFADAAGCYALAAARQVRGKDSISPALHWPWALTDWNPSTARRNLVKAGALILAEIDRLDRAADLEKEEHTHG